MHRNKNTASEQGSNLDAREKQNKNKRKFFIMDRPRQKKKIGLSFWEQIFRLPYQIRKIDALCGEANLVLKEARFPLQNVPQHATCGLPPPERESVHIGSCYLIEENIPDSDL